MPYSSSEASGNAASLPHFCACARGIQNDAATNATRHRRENLIETTIRTSSCMDPNMTDVHSGGPSPALSNTSGRHTTPVRLARAIARSSRLLAPSHAAEIQHKIEVLAKIAQGVIAALDDQLPASGVAHHGLAVIERLVARRRQQ